MKSQNLSDEALDFIRSILREGRKRCNRAIIDVCTFADYNTNKPFYAIYYGRCLDPKIYIKIAVSSKLTKTEFSDLLEASNIQLSPRFSITNHYVWKYWDNTDVNKLDLADLNAYLEENGCAHIE